VNTVSEKTMLLISPFMIYGAFFQALASFPTQKKIALFIASQD
jgi:hypothetical protein